MVSGIDWLSRSFPRSTPNSARICSKRSATSRPFLSPASVMTVKCGLLTLSHGPEDASAVLDKTAQSRLWRLLVKDRAAAAQSVSTVLGWDFERVVVAHGDVIHDGARQRASDALSWMAGGATPRLGTSSAVS